MTALSSEFNKVYDKYYEMKNENIYNNYDEFNRLAQEFLENIELSGNSIKTVNKQIKFACKYPSLLQYHSAIKIQKWWNRMHSKLLALNHIKYQQCEDCKKWRKIYINYNHKYLGKYNINWSDKNVIEELKKETELESNNELEIKDCCSDYLDYSSLGRCCYKYVCKKDKNKCSYLLFCCNNITLANENNFKDNGNNAEITCGYCNKINNINLIWYGMTINEYMDKYG